MVRGTLGVAALALLLAGCGDGPAGSDPGPTAAPSSTAAAVEEPLPCVAGVEAVPGAEEVTPAEAMAAYCLVAALVREHGFTELVRPGALRRPADVAPVRDLLTPQARARFDDAVAGWLAEGDPEAGRLLGALVLHDVTDVPRGYVLDAPWTHGTEVGAPRARSRPDGRLELRVTSTSGVVLVREGDDSGRHSVLPVTRRAAYVLEAGPDGWLLAQWSARHAYGEVRLVAG